MSGPRPRRCTAIYDAGRRRGRVTTQMLSPYSGPAVWLAGTEWLCDDCAKAWKRHGWTVAPTPGPAQENPKP